MRVRSYVIIVGLVCAVGGLLLSAFIFERQLALESKALDSKRALQFRNDALRFSDQIRHLFVVTDLLFGSQETYLLQASKEQASAALALCGSIHRQLKQSSRTDRDVPARIHQNLEQLLSTIEELEKDARDAAFSVSARQLDAFDETTYSLVEQLQELHKVADELIETRRLAEQNARSELDVLVWVLSILYLCLVVLMLFWAAKSVSRPLAQLSRSAERALSDMSAFEPVAGGPHEVQELTRHIGAFVRSLKDRIAESEEMSSELQYQATHDALTGLANRRNLEHILRRAEHLRYALCMIDLDQFKLVNDTSGHAAGDALLVQVGHILVKHVRPDDTVVRMGGDEFALLLRDCAEETAARIAERIRESVEALVFRWEATSHRIGCSIGIVCTNGEMQDVGDVMKRADAACYAAKDAGRNRVVVYDATAADADNVRGDLYWVQLINHALDNGEFLLFEQTIRPLKARHVAGVAGEVLLRLRDRDARELVPPGVFMPVAERYGLNTKIDRWVVSNVLDAAVAYRQLFDEEHTYWINLSGASLCDEAFVEFVRTSIQAAKLPEGSVNFEITETAVISNLHQAAEFIEVLRDLGCRFALDDFGSGLSSFGYLKSLPVDLIKIDGMFVRGILNDPIDRQFVQAIIQIAHTMNIRTVAEYVENDEILAVVSDLGADYAQGFGIGRPTTLLPQVWSESALAGAVTGMRSSPPGLTREYRPG